MDVKQIKDRFEINDDQIITIEIDPTSVECSEFIEWLNNDCSFEAELTNGTAENNVSGDFNDDDYSGNTLLNMLWESYCSK